MVVLRQSLVREPAAGVRKLADGTRRAARARVRHRPTWQLIDLLERCRHAQATDPRDYVYALLGLSVDEAEGQLQRTGTAVPDYTEPATQTFVRYAEHTVMMGGAIKLLYSAAANIGIRGGGGGVPSWVPDWSVRGGPLHVLSPRDDGGVNKYYAAGSLGALPARVRVSPATGWLEVGGVVAGRVARLGAAAAEPGPADPARFKSVYHRDLDAVARGAMQLEEFLASDMRTSPPHLEYVWRTLCCDVDLHTGEDILRAARGVPVNEGGRSAMIDGFDAVRQIWPAWRAVFGSGDDGPLDGLDQEDEAILVEHIGLLQGRTSDYLMATAPLCLGRRVAVLDDGRLAQVPPASEPGDVVFVPFGSAVPFALRPFGQDRGGRPPFRLLGECYVHSVMRGELLIEGRKAEDVVLA
ncbi:hypothetical protein B0T26DRAFT_724989 [Lasiosphaeria miniovina]|uniref:Uncharacterized protein n=1 Tax=Lasiosphaeria miniovina TaxID=1954250 RepID=A0AA39ZYF1_9PEZI|nr:uncharacterized protein B0T26DRAFT_724989 [Lasiosphaeria miniovina]KAK0705931.1 hypothetical protein B0T26DRAFT_724989 [Lasiosphaeria miniovina]